MKTRELTEQTERARRGNGKSSAVEDAKAAALAMHELVERSKRTEAAGHGLHLSMLEISRAMGSGQNLEAVLATILETTVREMRAQQGSILLFDEHKDRLSMLAAHGLPEEMVKKGYITRKGSIAEWVIENNHPLILNDRAKSEDFEALDARRQIKSSMCFPLRARGEILGTINLNRVDPGLPAFCDGDLEVMDILASQAAICIQNARLNEACVQSERLAAIGQTVAGISHCVKNLLTGLQGGVSLVKLGADQQSWDVIVQSVNVLNHSTGRISTLILDMLDYSKEREPERDRTDLAKLVAEIVEVTKTKAAAQESEVVVEIPEEAREVWADSHQIFRCLLNLVENALYATGEGRKVYVSAERTSAENALSRLSVRSETAVVIRVRDEGKGISEEHRGQIFEPFFSTKGSKGTGLGLAVTAKIIREHGGTIEVASPPGAPAVFAIYLPGDEIAEEAAA